MVETLSKAQTVCFVDALRKFARSLFLSSEIHILFLDLNFSGANDGDAACNELDDPLRGEQ